MDGGRRRRTLVTLAFCVGVWVAGTGTANACSCRRRLLADHAARAVVIVEGAIVSAGPVAEEQSMRLRVDAVYLARGSVDLGRELDVTYLHCNTGPVIAEPLRPYIWFLDRRDGALTTHLCSGGEEATPEGRGRVRRAIDVAMRQPGELNALEKRALSAPYVLEALLLGAEANFARASSGNACEEPPARVPLLGRGDQLLGVSYDIAELRQRMLWSFDLERDLTERLGRDTLAARLLRLGSTLESLLRARVAGRLDADRNEPVDAISDLAEAIEALEPSVPGLAGRLVPTLSRMPAIATSADLSRLLRETCDAVLGGDDACRPASDSGADWWSPNPCSRPP